MPAGWRSAFSVGGGEFNQFTASTSHPGWYELSAASVGGRNGVTGFNIVTARDDYGQKGAMTPRGITEAGEQVQLSETTGFKCVHFGATGELWIEPDPANPAKVRYSGAPADVKYFRIMLPENVAWKSAIPMISEDGAKGVPMEADPDRCGWYFARYIDTEPPTSVVIYRDDDEEKKEGIGMDGDWAIEGTPVEPIPLNTMFEFLGSNEIFFVAAEQFADKTDPTKIGWTATDPGAVGECGYPLAAIIYDTDAQLHGAFTCNPDWFDGIENQTPGSKGNACFYATAKYNVIANENGSVPCIGITTGMVEDTLGKDKKPKLTANGRKCFGSQADEAFTAMFNPTPGVNEAYCFDMPFTQTSDGKYEFDSDNYEGPASSPYPAKGGFYPAEKTPVEFLEGSEYLAAAESKRKAEGPVFVCADYNNQRNPGEGLRAIDPTEGVPAIDLFCNGPGWTGGVNCEGKFAGGSEFNAVGFRAPAGVSFEGDGWGWSCPNMGPIGWTYYKEGTETPVGNLTMKNQVPTGGVPRWTSGANDYAALSTGGRNQHFCFESHASFRYKKGLRFSFRGDDDIWVYIDNKLAVDLGGTHLAAPGYVDLDRFVGKQGAFTVGTEYDIDIFFCDRRTTMSNVRIKTNMFIKQTSGLAKRVVSKKSGIDSYELCYAYSSNGSCGGGSGAQICGPDLDTFLPTKNLSLDYTLTTKGNPPVVKATAEEMAAAKVYFGGIDLTNRGDPKIDKPSLTGLPPGDYVLWASIGSQKEKFEFTIEGTLDVVSKPGMSRDEAGNDVAPYEPVKIALASTDDNPTRVPIYVGSLMDQGESVIIDLASGVEQSYGITVTTAEGQPTSNVKLEYKDSTGNFQDWNGKSPLRTIGLSGIDTIYASLKINFMTAEKEQYDFMVAGHGVKTSVTFFAPKLVFVESETSFDQISGDDPLEERFVGPMYTFYLLALAPSLTEEGKYVPCDSLCNFPLGIGSLTSANITTPDSAARLVNGRASINIYSTKEYRIAGDGIADNPATLSITGPKADLINAVYTPLHFRKPPVPYPLFADIFDVHGKKSASELNMKEPYFDMGTEYLDGIADSLAIYYNRPFYNSPDSLPNRIVVYWDGDKDSVVVEKADFKVRCGADGHVDDTLCAPLITIGGIDFSKDIRTANPNANLKSYARYSDRGRVKEDGFPGNINDCVPPFIKAADVRKAGKEEDAGDALTLTLSEPVRILDGSYRTAAFTVYLNSAANYKTPDQKYVVGVKSVSAATIGGEKVTVVYKGTDDNPTPHTGDYIRFRTDSPIWTDEAVNVAGTDTTLRDASHSLYAWNFPTSYDSRPDPEKHTRLPSPWTMITGEAEIGVKAIKYTEVGPEYWLDSLSKPKDSIKITSVKAYPVTTTFDEVVADNPGKLGFFLKSDMNSLVYSDTIISKYFTNPGDSAFKNIVLEIQLDFFTNLGGFVAHEVQKIRCTDEKIFGDGHSCLDTQKNFFISWNLVSKDKRMVGTGAYVSKMTTAVHLGKFGKKNKMEETQMWGVRRTKGAKKPAPKVVED